MPEYDNHMRGVLFRNSRKETDKHPDHQGNCEIEGKQYWISAWVKTSQKGIKFFSLSFKPKAAPKEQPQQEFGATQPDDDIPF